MDDWQIPQQQQQQQRMPMNSTGPMHSYHAARTRPSPYPMNEMKPNYHYQQASTHPVKTNSTSNVYTPLPYPPTHMEQIPHQQRLIPTKSVSGPISTYNSGQQQIMSARTRSMPYPSPSMYNHPAGSICQCTSHMHYPSQHQMYYPNYYPSQPITYQQNSNAIKYETMKTPIKSKLEDSFTSSAAYHPSTCSNSYIPAQQLPPQSSEYQTFSHQSQIFPSPPSNPSTPYQGEFNGNTEFGVPYQQGQPSSVNSLTDALCPSGDTTDRQLTPGPPSVGTPRVAQHQYSFPQTPSTPRLSSEHNIDELTAFLQDPINIYLTDDITSTLLDDIEVLADTYLGGRGGQEQQSTIDNSLDYDIILNYLCSDDLISTVCTK